MMTRYLSLIHIFCHLGGLVLRELPRLFRLDALRQRFLLDATLIIVHLCHPNDVAICKAHEIKVRRAVIINEQRRCV